MNIILEGPDAAGKSLYASKFVKNGFTYYKCTPGEHALESNFDKKYFEDQLNKDSMVFDRFFISELVFSELYNRDQAISFNDVNSLLFKNINNIKLIILYASNTDVLKNRCIERGEFDYLDELDEQNKLFVKYAWVFDAYESNNIILIDVSKYNSIDDVLDVVNKIVGE